MVESGKNIFQSYFLEIWGGGGGRVSPHPRYGKAEVLTLGNLYVNEILANIRSNKRQEKEALQFSH